MTERQKTIVIVSWLAGAVLLSYALGDMIFHYGGEGAVVIAGFAYLGLLLAITGAF